MNFDIRFIFYIYNKKADRIFSACFSFYAICTLLIYQYIPPIEGSAAGIAGAGSFMSATNDSVVRTMLATDAAF